MTRITISGSEEHFTGEYADPKIAYYYAYQCCYCETWFYRTCLDCTATTGIALTTLFFRFI
jgi:hypothetical protein